MLRFLEDTLQTGIWQFQISRNVYYLAREALLHYRLRRVKRFPSDFGSVLDGLSRREVQEVVTFAFPGRHIADRHLPVSNITQFLFNHKAATALSAAVCRAISV